MAKKKKQKKKAARCRHNFGPLQWPSDEPVGYRVCEKCRRTKFEGDRQVF